MIRKYLIRPERRRYVPHQFSWIDHRFVRDRHICNCSPEALALYLFLVVVGDSDGLSFYSDSSIQNYLAISPKALRKARQQLVKNDLIAYEPPLYQVLCLVRPVVFKPSHSSTSHPARAKDDDDDLQGPVSQVAMRPPKPPTPLATAARVNNTTHISKIIDQLIGRPLS